MFSEKFHLLNSQEHSVDIYWSSSSSEYESTSCNKLFVATKTQNRKRKRKKKVLANVSNLDVKILDTSKSNISDKKIEKSPVLICRNTYRKSPILTSSTRFPPIRDLNSPVLNGSFCPTSPILLGKYTSPTTSKVARKKLFCDNSNYEDDDKNDKLLNEIKYTKMIKKDEKRDDTLNSNAAKSGCNSSITSADSNVSYESDLVKKTKSFFDSKFSSESTSQQISDTPTPDCSNKSISDETDISSCKSLLVKNNSLSKSEQSSSNTIDNEKLKKNRYKKGGLAYRFNILLKKHNANISLWQHERFLSANSNFIIPKSEHIIFRIIKKSFKYNCYTLEAMNLNDVKYLILINNLYVTCNIIDNSILKLYEPFKILDMNPTYKIIINVCKFEIIDYKKELY